MWISDTKMATNQVSQSNAPKQLRMTDFKAAADRAGSFARGCRFIVRIYVPDFFTNQAKELHYMCDAAELPGRGFGLAEARYYGPSQVFPTNTQYQPASFSFLCRSDCTERRLFDDWMELINPTTNFNFEYANNYWSQIDIFQYADYASSVGSAGPAVGGNLNRPQNSKNWQPHVTYSWRLYKAWPTIVNPQPVTWGEQDVLRLQVQFAYKYWDRPTLQ
jgi:hypothetical protein